MLKDNESTAEDDLKLVRKVVRRLSAIPMAPAEQSVVELAGVVERMLLREMERTQGAK